jgi:hypothetical protein
MQLMRDNITMIPDGNAIHLWQHGASSYEMVDWDLDKTNFLNSAEVLNAFEK